MENYNAERAEYFTCLLGKYSALLNFSVNELKVGFTDYCVIITERIEKGITEKSVQIRFDEDGLTVTCTFNDWGKCDCVRLLLDKRVSAEEFWECLRWVYGEDERERRVVTRVCVVKLNKKTILITG